MGIQVLHPSHRRPDADHGAPYVDFLVDLVHRSRYSGLLCCDDRTALQVGRERSRFEGLLPLLLPQQQHLELALNKHAMSRWHGVIEIEFMRNEPDGRYVWWLPEGLLHTAQRPRSLWPMLAHTLHPRAGSDLCQTDWRPRKAQLRRTRWAWHQRHTNTPPNTLAPWNTWAGY